MTLPRLAVAVAPGPAPPARLVAACVPWCHLVPFDPAGPDPDAILVTDPAAPLLPAALATEAPVALVHPADCAVPEPILHQIAVTVTLAGTEPGTAPQPADGSDAIVLSPFALRPSAHPPISPFVRSRWREAHGLDPDLTVRIGFPDPWPTAAVDAPAALALGAVAAVRGPWLTTALALATPVVTTAADARRLGAEHGVAVLVADAVDPGPELRALVADRPRATALGWGARQLVETRRDLNLDLAAVAVLDRLGIGPAPFPDAPLADLDARLAELGTPYWSAVRNRALTRAASLNDTTDRTVLTGSSR